MYKDFLANLSLAIRANLSRTYLVIVLVAVCFLLVWSGRGCVNVPVRLEQPADSAPELPGLRAEIDGRLVVPAYHSSTPRARADFEISPWSGVAKDHEKTCGEVIRKMKNETDAELTGALRAAGIDLGKRGGDYSVVTDVNTGNK